MERYNLSVVLVSLVPPSPAVLLADPQWTSSDEHTCSRMKDDIAVWLCWESEREPAPPALKPAIGTVKHKILLRIKSELPPCRAIKDNMVFCKTRLHVGLFQRRYNGTYTQARGQLVNCLAGSLYEALYKVLMNIN